MFTFGTIFALVRLYASGALKWVLSIFSDAFEWLTKDWRHIAITALAIFSLWHQFYLAPMNASRIAGLEADLEAERLAHTQTVTNYRLATARAERDAKENAARVVREQAAQTKEIVDDFEARLAHARARAAAVEQRMQRNTASGADPGGAAPADLPVLPGTARGADAPAAQVGLSPEPGQHVACPEDRVCLTIGEALTATETALQLDSLISWIERQAAIRFSPVEATDDDG
ncbi:MAG: hypothetical protein AAF494_01795 [Pseudomonadota bacterium]